MLYISIYKLPTTYINVGSSATFYHFKSFYNVQQSETKSGFSLQCSFGMDGGLFAALLYSINHTSKIHSNSPQYLTAQVTCHKVYRSDEYTWYSF